MKTICGLDLHKSIMLMCIMKANGQKIVQEFTTLTCDIKSMREMMKKMMFKLLAWKARTLIGFLLGVSYKDISI